jgi:hypothetical protein
VRMINVATRITLVNSFMFSAVLKWLWNFRNQLTHCVLVVGLLNAITGLMEYRKRPRTDRGVGVLLTYPACLRAAVCGSSVIWFLLSSSVSNEGIDFVY